MNEPKKRGRPAKNVIGNFAGGVGGKPVPDVIQFYDAPEMVNLVPKREMLDPTSDIDTFDRPPFVSELVRFHATPDSEADKADVEAQMAPYFAAQTYAMRVWNGQSVSLPRNERIKRVMAALDGQNLPTDGVELP